MLSKVTMNKRDTEEEKPMATKGMIELAEQKRNWNST